MRLDKFLADMGLGSRKEVKGLIKKGTIEVNGQVVKSDKAQVNEFEDTVTYLGEIIAYQKDFYYILHKPAGVISATQDNHDQTVIDLLEDQDYREDLFPVGRLDKDTEGLLILTNDGVFAHQLLSPKKHVEKEYLAEVNGIMTVAIIMPQKIAREDFLISISRRDAIRDPVHAPVPGSGIPTNSISPQNSYFFT